MSNENDKESPRIISLGQIEINPDKFNKQPDLDDLLVLPTQNLVLFPGVTTPLSLVSVKSKQIASMAYETTTPIGIVCQLSPDIEVTKIDSLQKYGVVADVLKIFDLPDGQRTALVLSLIHI